MSIYTGFKMVGDSTLRVIFKRTSPRFVQGDTNWDLTWDYETVFEDIMTPREIVDHVRFSPLNGAKPDPVVVQALKYLQNKYPQCI